MRISKKKPNPLKSYEILKIISFFIKNPRLYYTSEDFLKTLNIRKETWQQKHRPRLLEENIIVDLKGKIEDVDMRKNPFKFKKSEFLKYAYNNFTPSFVQTSKDIQKKIKKLRKKYKTGLESYRKKYNYLIEERPVLDTLGQEISSKADKLKFDCKYSELNLTAKKYFILQKTVIKSLSEILKVLGYPSLMENLRTVSYLDQTEKKAWDKRKKYKTTEISKENFFPDLETNMNIAFNIIEGAISVPTELKNKKDNLYTYFEQTVEVILKKEENIKSFKQLFEKTVNLWAINMQRYLNDKELIILKRQKAKVIPHITSICLLNQKLDYLLDKNEQNTTSL